MALLSVIGKSLAKKTSKDSSKEVAKRSTEVMARKPEKFMGMAEEVQPKRLSGPAAEEATKRGSGMGKAAVAAGLATATGIAAMSGRDKEEKNEPTKAVAASRVSEGKVTKAEAEPEKETIKAKEASKASTFGTAFKEARAAGKDTFTYEGKKYTTEMAGEKKAAEKSIGVREGRNENIGDDTRERARAFVEAKTGPRALASEDDATKRLAKGGMVRNQGIGASMKPHNVFGKKK